MRLKVLCWALVLLCCSLFCAYAEQDDFDEQGEWYVGTYYSNDLVPAYINEQGVYTMELNGFDITVTKDGIVTTDGEEDIANVAQLPCDALFLYDTYYDSLRKIDRVAGLLIFPVDDGYAAVVSQDVYPVLLLNEKAIRYDGESVAEYYRSGNQFFLTDGKTYSRGKITVLGDEFFLYAIDGEPLIYKYRDYDESQGDPTMFFIKSSILQ